MFSSESSFYSNFVGHAAYGMETSQADLSGKSLQAIFSDLTYGNKSFGERGLAALQLQLQTGQLRGQTLNQVVECSRGKGTALTAILRQPGAMRDAVLC
jgi:hypothetical protein